MNIKIASKIRKTLNADTLIKILHSNFNKINDHRKCAKISIADALMAGFAIFSLKDPSLLAFDERRLNNDPNLHNIYHIDKVPCDSQMRAILDKISPHALESSFKDIFSQLQREKALEQFTYMNGCYLYSLDGTGYFSSSKLSSDACLTKKNKKTEMVTYHQQMLGGAIVHPDLKEVIPFNPEMIIKQDGETKNDCERNAAKRFLKKLREDHPSLPLIIIEDGLSSNAPHINDLLSNGMNFILGAKPGDHKFLYEQVIADHAKGKVTVFKCKDRKKPKTTHYFHFINNVPLNASNTDCIVNFIDYQEVSPKKTINFSWVTNFTITKENVFEIMRGGRARWKIENETFNTLKNQGYSLEHNYGLGKKYLSENFARLTMLAFLVDQVQQICCSLFRSVWKKYKSKRSLWEKIRFVFHIFVFDSMEDLLRALLIGIKKGPPVLNG